jgi:DNA-binding NarL/FixJ family response regulator
MVYPPVTQFETRALRVAAQRPLRVIVGEANALLRAGLVRMLEDAGFDVVAQAADADDLRRKLRGHRPDVVVTGAEIARGVNLPHVIVAAEAGDARALLDGRCEGIGFLLIGGLTDGSRLADAVTRVARGGTVLDPEVVSAMIRLPGELTPRERDVLEEMAEGKSNRAIAEALYVSERAVERHISAIFGKLQVPTGEHVHRRVLAVLRAHAA